MTTISKEHSDRLYWLGRYTERAFTSLRTIQKLYDKMLDRKNGELSEDDLKDVSGGVLAEIAIVASGVALFAGIMTEVNNSRKAAGKKPIW